MSTTLSPVYVHLDDATVTKVNRTKRGTFTVDLDDVVTLFGTADQLRSFAQQVLGALPEPAPEAGCDDPSSETQVACSGHGCVSGAGHAGPHETREAEVVA